MPSRKALCSLSGEGVALGSISGLIRGVVDSLRAAGHKVGLLRIRYLRPLPYAQIAEALRGQGRFRAVDDADIAAIEVQRDAKWEYIRAHWL